jgi:hypothetical protein
MADTTPPLILSNVLWVVPTHKPPVVKYLNGLFDDTKTQTSADGVRFWVNDPAVAAQKLVNQAVAKYAGQTNPFTGWPVPVSTDPNRFRIYWAVVRLMESEQTLWPGLINPAFRYPVTDFEPNTRPKRVWFGNVAP